MPGPDEASAAVPKAEVQATVPKLVAAADKAHTPRP